MGSMCMCNLYVCKKKNHHGQHQNLHEDKDSDLYQKKIKSMTSLQEDQSSSTRALVFGEVVGASEDRRRGPLRIPHWVDTTFYFLFFRFLFLFFQKCCPPLAFL